MREKNKSAGLNSKQDVLDLRSIAITHPQTLIFSCVHFSIWCLIIKCGLLMPDSIGTHEYICTAFWPCSYFQELTTSENNPSP